MTHVERITPIAKLDLKLQRYSQVYVTISMTISMFSRIISVKDTSAKAAAANNTKKGNI